VVPTGETRHFSSEIFHRRASPGYKMLARRSSRGCACARADGWARLRGRARLGVCAAGSAGVVVSRIGNTGTRLVRMPRARKPPASASSRALRSACELVTVPQLTRLARHACTLLSMRSGTRDNDTHQLIRRPGEAQWQSIGQRGPQPQGRMPGARLAALRAARAAASVALLGLRRQPGHPVRIQRRLHTRGTRGL